MSVGSEGRIPVAVLGATGAVGQTFIRLLEGHPFLEVSELAASERSAGRLYREAMSWHEGKLPEHLMDLTVLPCDPGAVKSKVVFSALDSSVAGSVEQAFARAGAVVLSNAKNHRMDADVPLVIPEVNADHLMLIDRQKEARGWEGAIITNSNCAVAPMTMALAPLHAAFGVRQAVMVTLQAISGAGYPGVPSLDILGNVIPHIPGEEEKIEPELNKMLGELEAGQVVNAPIIVSTHCNRVPVQHGHTVCMTLGFESSAGPEEVLEAMSEWQGHSICKGLPSAPSPPLVVRPEVNRPQARKDVDEGAGMAVVVGRVRSDPLMDVSLTAMAHNTVRGAAGGSILNAEVLGRMGRLPGVTEGAW
ncbi:MAG: aspartate-semialdehyde dehydrogenase [Gemmatimonadota bacterium]|jgi:aspartate-semialdehyde dehydrogenase|nr:aspartate-semialdehyde dehydrogenase [Gemmatimonadota bacterium]|tara:strand:- start:1047 stop:2132 length:1086 start_codon:yes stop_codon:yes gene_type:complete